MMRLTSVAHPFAPGSPRVPVFRDAQTAAEHVCDHLLTAPECEAWAVIIPDLQPVLCSKARFRLARRAWGEDPPPGDALQPIYDPYAEVIARTVAESKALGWWWKDGADWKLFGLDGVLVVLGSDAVRTAYVPGRGDPLGTELAHSDGRSRRIDPLPRESGRGSISAPGPRPSEEAARRGWRRKQAARHARRLPERCAAFGEVGASAAPEAFDRNLKQRWIGFRRAMKAVRSELLATLRARCSQVEGPGLELLLGAIASYDAWRALKP